MSLSVSPLPSFTTTVTGPAGQTIAGSTTFTFNVPVGFGYQTGDFFVRALQAVGISSGSNVNTVEGNIRNPNVSTSYSDATLTAGIYTSGYSRIVDSTLGLAMFSTSALGTGIALLDVYFSGGNVAFDFRNTTGSTLTLASGIRFRVAVKP